MAVRKSPSVTYPNAAGIDIGAASHFVAVPADRDEQPVREFPAFTADLERLAAWLRDCGVDAVAMESTGVYWIPAFELLEANGFTVFLVNARHVKNVSGRKSDVLDCQWLQQLMSYGLLAGAFRPKEEFCELRELCRQREMLVRYQVQHVHHMQKAMAQMNLRLDNVISDITGVSGQRIIRAIIAGERDPVQLARLRDKRLRASEEMIVKSLQGNWRPEHLFVLRQAMQLYDAYAQMLHDCDRQVATTLERLACVDRSESEIDLRAILTRFCGVDLTRINGIGLEAALKLIAEIGPDLSRFPTVKHFASWLGLCPGTQISGGKVLSRASKRTANRAAQVLRLAAMGLRKSQTSLGAYFRRMLSRVDKSKAITATAHKLARLIYLMLTKGVEYVDQGQAYYEERHRERVLHHLNRRAAAMGFQLMPVDDGAPT